MRRYVDTEFRYMLLAFWAAPALVVVVALASGPEYFWTFALAGTVPMFLLQAIAPAHTVIEVSPRHLILRNNLRRVHVTPESLANIKGLFEGRWNAHVSLRNRHGVYVELRVWKFNDEDALAERLLDIAHLAGDVARPSAVRILARSMGQ